MSIRPTPTSELGQRFPGLQMLASTYVTVTFDYSFGSPEEAVLAFGSDFPELRASAAAGIDALFDEFPDEAARGAALEELDWGYAPRPGHLDQLLRWASQELRAGESGGRVSVADSPA